MRADKLKPHIFTVLSIPLAAFIGTVAALVQVYGKLLWHVFLHSL